MRMNKHNKLPVLLQKKNICRYNLHSWKIIQPNQFLQDPGYIKYKILGLKMYCLFETFCSLSLSRNKTWQNYAVGLKWPEQALPLGLTVCLGRPEMGALE